MSRDNYTSSLPDSLLAFVFYSLLFDRIFQRCERAKAYTKSGTVFYVDVHQYRWIIIRYLLMISNLTFDKNYEDSVAISSCWNIQLRQTEGVFSLSCSFLSFSQIWKISFMKFDRLEGRNIDSFRNFASSTDITAKWLFQLKKTTFEEKKPFEKKINGMTIERQEAFHLREKFFILK